MADSRDTPPTGPDEHRPDDQVPGDQVPGDQGPVSQKSGSAGASTARPAGEEAPVTGVAQRHDLPRRRAGTMPDVSRRQDGTSPNEEDDADAPGLDGRGGDDGGAAEANPAPATRAVPISPTAAASPGHGEDLVAGTAGDDDGQHSSTGAGSDEHPVPTASMDSDSQPVDNIPSPGRVDGNQRAADELTADPADGDDPRPRTTAAPVDPAPTAGQDAHPHTAENPALDRDAARRAAVRDGVITARPPFPRFLQVVVALFFPIIVLAAAVRAVATSSFLWIEYNRPGFPADRFGFSLDDRMTYGSYALDYVLNFAPPRYLGDLTTAEGTPLFLESEVGHMADVKGVLGLAFAVALVLFVLTVLACTYLARRYKGGIRRGLFAGAVITLVGIVALAVLAVTAWEAFFTQVHALFFSEGTWTFRVDDTLIRLFPEQFWTDSAVVVGILVVVATLLTLVLTWPTKARRERSKRAQEAQQMRYLESLRSS